MQFVKLLGVHPYILKLFVVTTILWANPMSKIDWNPGYCSMVLLHPQYSYNHNSPNNCVPETSNSIDLMFPILVCDSFLA